MKILSTRIDNVIINLKKCENILDNKIKQYKIQSGGGKQKRKLRTYKNTLQDTIKLVVYFRTLAQYYMNMYATSIAQYGETHKRMEYLQYKLQDASQIINNVDAKYTLNLEKAKMLEGLMDSVKKMKDKRIDIEMVSKLDSNGLINSNVAKIHGVIPADTLYQTSDPAINPLSGNGKDDKNNEIIDDKDDEIINDKDDEIIENKDDEIIDDRGEQVIDKSGIKINQVGGNASQHDVELLGDELELIYNKAENYEKNSIFLDKKMEELKNKMKILIEDDENIFKLRAKVEWIVNKLEDCNENGKSDGLDLERIKKLIAEIQEKMNHNNEDKLLDYINGLEKYIAMLDAQTKSSLKTIGGLSTNNFNEMENELDKTITPITVGVADPLVPLIGGFEKSPLDRDYRQKISVAFDNLSDQIQKQTGDIHNLFNFDEEKYGKFKKSFDDNQYTDAYVITYKKSVVLTLLFLNYMEAKKLYNTLCENLSIKTDSYKKDQKVKNILSITFANKKTDFYKILFNKDHGSFEKYDIFDQGNNLIQKINEYYNLKKDEQLIGTYVNMCIDKNYDDLINTLNESFLFYSYCSYSFLSYISSISQVSSSNETKNIILLEIIKKYSKNLVRGNHFMYKEFNEKYMVGGNNQKIIDVLKDLSKKFNEFVVGEEDRIKKIYNEESNIRIYEKYQRASKKNNENKSIIQSMKNDIANDSANILNRYVELKDMIQGVMPQQKEIDEDTRKWIKDVTNKINTLQNLDVNQINEVLSTKKSESTEPDESSESTELSKKFKKIRLDPFKKKLMNAYNSVSKLTPFIEVLSNKIMELANSGNINDLFKLYDGMKKDFEDAQNNFIKIIPMVFFVIEFTPSVYNTKDKKFYLLEHLQDTYSIKYSQISGQQYDGSIDFPNETAGTDDEKKYLVTKGAHMGFFESNQKNTTANIINDPLIGLTKLISSGESNIYDIYPKTKNIMFALGASGTGKTSRYFGLPNSSIEGDKKGIIPILIENTVGAEISFSYFVCYGRTIGDLNTTINLEELIIFFHIKDIIDNSDHLCKLDANDNDNMTNANISCNYGEYISAYKQKKESTSESTSDSNNFINFYEKLVTKKLEKVNGENVINFLKGSDEEKLPKITSESETDETFRKLLENNNDKMWIKIDTNNKDKMSDFFENLLIFQKKIFTVMPTRNNIESSRGHTCVLIKFVENGKTSYFPLFDMAGTENIEKIQKFISSISNKKKLGELLVGINRLGERKYVENKEGKNYVYSSLHDIIGDDSKSNPTTSWIKSGGYKKCKVGTSECDKFIDFNQMKDQTISNIESVNDDILTKLVDKIQNEGNYINHTIAMIIFASLCVGYGMDSSIGKKGSIDNHDYFDDILENRNETRSSGIRNALKKNGICLYGNNSVKDDSHKTKQNSIETKESRRSTKNKKTNLSSDDKQTKEKKKCVQNDTKILLSKFDYTDILNNSCIWLNVLFSFLYWNEFNDKTNDNFIDKVAPLVKEKDKNNNEISKYGKYVNINVDESLIKKYEKIKTIFDELIEKNTDSHILELKKKADVLHYNIFRKIDGKKSVIHYNVNYKFVDNSGFNKVYENADNPPEISDADKLYNMLYILKGKKAQKIPINTLVILSILAVNGCNINDLFTARNIDKKNITVINVSTITDTKGDVIFNLNKFREIYNNSYGINKFTNMTDEPNGFNNNNQLIGEITKVITAIDLSDNLIRNIYRYNTATSIFNNGKYNTSLKKAEKINISNVAIPQKTQFVFTTFEQKAQLDSTIEQIITKINGIVAGSNITNEELCEIYNDGDTIDNIYTIIDKKKKSEVDKQELKKLIDTDNKLTTDEQKEINLIKDGFTTPTKMTLMHLVTGQYFKKDMVIGTMNLVETLYSATEIKL